MGLFWSKFSKYEINSESVLDRVISQASDHDQCLLYTLANYKKGGQLIDAFNSANKLEEMMKQCSSYMYNEGRGKIINRNEYLRWRFRNENQLILPIESSYFNRYDPLTKWNDHEACWQMQYRGSLGETLIHVLIICDTEIHTKIASYMLKLFPRLSIDCVEGEEYLGASALHLAIAYNNNKLVHQLIEAGAIVNQRAIGNFFLPKDQQRRHPAKQTDYEGLAYMGEYPLAWAACCANETVYNLLLDNGANPDLQDSFGNMVLHMVVVGDKLDMFGYALRHPKIPASNEIKNHTGLTPLTLACTLGRAEVFREMLELSAREFWRYSNITCSAYPLNALDTLSPDGRTNWNSALFIILNGTKEEHLDMLDGGIIQRLLEEKWKTFARRQFLKRLAILFLHLFMLSTAIYLRPTDKTESLLSISEWHHIARYCFEIGTVCGVLSYIVVQQGGEMVNQGFLTFLKQVLREPAKAIFLASNILILALIPFRLYGDKQTEEAVLVFAVPGSWFLLMFFAGAVRLTGPFVTMVYSMITGDMLTFGIIYLIILFGFSQSFYFLFKGSPGVSETLYSSYSSTWMAMFHTTLGDYSYQEFSSTAYPAMTKAVFTTFMILVPILLLNMLIAMMGNTYAHVIEQSEKEWMRQWAKIVVALERAINQKDAQRYLQEYSIKLGPSDDPSTEQRGVMVIKSKNKTRAKQRKGAVANWKRVGKVTINALRKKGFTGEQLRREMWSRGSISTPVKNLLNKHDTTDKSNETLNANSAFSGALTAALDVMAFAHDIDLSGRKKTANEKARKYSGSTVTSLEVPVLDINDPFRQLVIFADNPKAKEKELTDLAAAAVAYVETSINNVSENNTSTRSVKQIPQLLMLEQSDSDDYKTTAGQSTCDRQTRSHQIHSAQIRNFDKPKPHINKECSNNSDLSHLTCDLRIHNKIQDPETFKKRNKNSKRRPKTAKTNRVVPISDTSSKREISSARYSEYHSESSPDPLEPWSIRGISSINQILAKEQSDRESL